MPLCTEPPSELDRPLPACQCPRRTSHAFFRSGYRLAPPSALRKNRVAKLPDWDTCRMRSLRRDPPLLAIVFLVLAVVSPSAAAGAPPVPRLEVPSPRLEVGEEMLFVTRSNDPDGYVKLEQFDFDGDGVFDETVAPGVHRVWHTYTAPGVYTVRYRIEDGDGEVAEITTQVEVVPAQPDPVPSGDEAPDDASAPPPEQNKRRTKRRCGNAFGPVLTLYNVRSVDVSCGRAKRVARKWLSKVLAGSCSRFRCSPSGFRCRAQAPARVRYGVRCRRGLTAQVRFTVVAD